MADYISELTGPQMDESLLQMAERLPEQWAVGEIDGAPVPSTNPRYHNNAKWWAEESGRRADNFVTTPPTAPNTVGLKFAVLNSEPPTKYEGWLYLITE